jgi:hypothetical protein
MKTAEQKPLSASLRVHGEGEYRIIEPEKLWKHYANDDLGWLHTAHQSYMPEHDELERLRSEIESLREQLVRQV